MTKQKCPHGSALPRGLICDRNYLIIRLKTNKGPYNRGCGAHTKEMEAIARIELGRIREQQYLNTFGLPSKTRRIKFDEARKLFIQKHYVEWRDPSTNQPRGAKSIGATQGRFNTMGEFFDGFYLDAISLKDLKDYRAQKLEFDDMKAGSLNRHMADMSSLFTQFERWNMEDPHAPQIKLAPKNPCEYLPDLLETPRKRIASMEELRRLKLSCKELNDLAMWSIIETELHTSLRYSDLMKLENISVVEGQFTLKQGKTGGDISFPASAKPQWSKVFTNFQARWEKARKQAMCCDLQFRDLRRTGLQMLEKTFTVDQISMKAGHADSKMTKWYLSGNNSEKISPMVETMKKLLEEL